MDFPPMYDMKVDVVQDPVKIARARLFEKP